MIFNYLPIFDRVAINNDFKIRNYTPRYSTNTCFDLIINLEECLQNHFLLLKGLSTFPVFNIS